jgi:hypothetical protein
MASLAILVSILFLIVILIGPMCYILTSFEWMPKWIVWTFGLISIIIGGWWLCLPLPIVRFIGLLPIFLGIKIIQRKK